MSQPNPLLDEKAGALKSGVEENAWLFWLYIASYPLARRFVRLKVSANLVTLFSLLTAVASLICLIVKVELAFILLWILSILLDLCDGMVARIDGSASSGKFDVDGFCDLLKILLVVVVGETLLDDKAVSLASTLFLGSLLIHRFINASAFTLSEEPATHVRAEPRKIIIFPRGFRAYLFVPLGTFNAHSLFLLVALATRGQAYLCVLLYLTSVLVLQIMRICGRYRCR